MQEAFADFGRVDPVNPYFMNSPEISRKSYYTFTESIKHLVYRVHSSVVDIERAVLREDNNIRRVFGCPDSMVKARQIILDSINKRKGNESNI